ncbi:MAG TPA: methylmalonyl Co-A mutase-associated GTPase MeaB [Pseudomonadota bacterium]|nr:methylmalonyl Co-A mutase-associated GTPase MeaB [Pseudomonadota bacterium]
MIQSNGTEQGRAQELAASVRGGDLRLAARLIRDLDDRLPLARAVLRQLWPHTGRAFILGITGNPGAGKSTVVDNLISQYRQQGLRVGVVAIDPSSPFSGGAILGDRIRMQRHAPDHGVFTCPLAARGHLGGLSRSTGEIVAVLDAMGFDLVIIETVGVGQGEIDVVAQADTKVVVTVPGLGDEVQAIKAGILEIADVLVVNKADREGADRTVRDLLTMLDLRDKGDRGDRGDKTAQRPGPGAGPTAPVKLQALDAADAPGRDVEIIRTVAMRGEGLPELVAAIARHRTHTAAATAARQAQRARRELREVLLDRLGRAIDDRLAQHYHLVEEVQRRATDPYSAADRLLHELLRDPEAAPP